MFASILKAIASLGAIFDYFKQKKLTDSIEDKYEAIAEVEVLKTNIEITKKQDQREKDVESLNNEVQEVVIIAAKEPKVRKPRKAKVIEG